MRNMEICKKHLKSVFRNTLSQSFRRKSSKQEIRSCWLIWELTRRLGSAGAWNGTTTRGKQCQVASELCYWRAGSQDMNLMNILIHQFAQRRVWGMYIKSLWMNWVTSKAFRKATGAEKLQTPRLCQARKAINVPTTVPHGCVEVKCNEPCRSGLTNTCSKASCPCPNFQDEKIDVQKQLWPCQLTEARGGSKFGTSSPKHCVVSSLVPRTHKVGIFYYV